MKDKIRNFSIIAHIDHGKTTLSDRFLEITKTVDQRLMHERFLDSHPISQERGVTIKLAPVRMTYKLPENLRKFFKFEFCVLNLIDTPGHIDFSYEVSRSLACCEGAILLVDATQGIQAQTLVNFHLAERLNLKIIPVINKIDLVNAQPEKTASDLINSFHFLKEEIIFISAKTGKNVDKVLQSVVKEIPSPQGGENKPLRALVFDSFYHPYKGIVVYVKIVDGILRTRQKVKFLNKGKEFEAEEVGYLNPKMNKVDFLKTGEIGYVATGLKNANLCQIGDTITNAKAKVISLPGYKQPKPMVFFEFYPVNNEDFSLLKQSLIQLKLNDSALFFSPSSSTSLGKGFRVGFLGVFHAFITQERLEEDFNLSIIITNPSVEYQVKTKNGHLITIQRASDLPDLGEILEIREPWAKVSIFSPLKFLGAIFKLCQEKRGKLINQKYYGSYLKIDYEMPLIEIIENFFDKLKSISSGFASFDYQLINYRPFKAVKMTVLINKQEIDSLSSIIEQKKGERRAKRIAKKLKQLLPRQLFEIPIQVALNGRIVARETVKAFRKDVTAKLYGGDQTRKDKLLKKQKKGKKRMKQFGKVIIPQEAFLSALKIES